MLMMDHHRWNNQYEHFHLHQDREREFLESLNRLVDFPEVIFDRLIDRISEHYHLHYKSIMINEKKTSNKKKERFTR